MQEDRKSEHEERRHGEMPVGAEASDKERCAAPEEGEMPAVEGEAPSENTGEGQGSERVDAERYDGEQADGERSHNQDLGRRGENAAARFLERHGMQILDRNWRCMAGEVDIIALEEDALHFVEVKTRSNVAHGFPAEALDARRRDRYERIAAHYLAQSEGLDELSVMFDIVSIVVTGPNRAFLRFHRNAFAGSR